MMAILALLIFGIFALAVLAVLVEILRRLFWLTARVAAGVAGAAVAAIVAAMLVPDAVWLALPVALLSFVAVVRVTRGWGAAAIPTGVRITVPRAAALPAVPALIEPALQEALDATERALERAARDPAGGAAGEWLEFWRLRVPELIAAARDVWDDAAASERQEVVDKLSASLRDVIAEADRRIGVVQAARRDRFTTRTNHAAARVRGG